ncbi:hypothetical protein GIB67_019881 [Kingdonia uniflora]|uniref:Uncharacterized protein n=1 Tax=Kingdonia uniflora TaxID=39325 RepID=A0A7J7MKA5_9MAGN|nr:hypothetical protein GIB67_019881 [Kingdonia uniflora]
MASISGCAKADEADLVGHLTLVIGVGDDEDTVAELIEWPRLKGSRVEYPTAQFDYGLTLPLSNLAKSVMNLIGACPAQLNYNFWEVILVYETLNGRWAVSGSEKRITAKDFLEYYAVKYVTATNCAYPSSSSSRPCFFDLSSAGRVWNDNLLWVSGINCQVSRKESFIDVAARRLQAKKRLAGKTPGSMEEKLSTPKLNTPLKLARLNEISDGPVDMATVSSTVVRNLAKRKAVKMGVAPHSVSSEVQEERDKIAEGADLRPHFEVEVGLLEEQCRAKAREMMVAVMDDEFKKGEKSQLDEKLTREREAFQLEREKEREVAALKLKEVRAESEAEAE